jgi:tRNA (cmo5U34)-methyltransferase
VVYPWVRHASDCGSVSCTQKRHILQNKPIPISGQSNAPDINLWDTPEHALDYLKRADAIPHRTEGEAVLLDCLPWPLSRVLDLGSGGGRLLSLVKLTRPEADAVAVDFSPIMLEQLRERFAADPQVQIVAHDLDQPLPALGQFEAVVSSFAIHHLRHDRKRSLYAEIYRLLTPGGVFCNLEHVASPTETLHRRFLAALAVQPEDEDPSNKLLDLETQLVWLREIGFTDVDCHWKWLELALLAGTKPAS